MRSVLRSMRKMRSFDGLARLAILPSTFLSVECTRCGVERNPQPAVNLNLI
jgi:hypothetical protein